MEKGEIARKLFEHEQEHVLRFFDQLTLCEKDSLFSQIEKIDWSLLEKVHQPKGRTERKREPLNGLSLEEIEDNYDAFYQCGVRALCEKKVGAVLLAGGQGTRLGSNAPKGTYNIGLNRELSIFEQLMNNLKEVCDRVGVSVPLFIMTSEKNSQETQDFFSKHCYFGYPKEDIYFFEQEMAPCVDFEGKLLLEEKGRIATSPNGNGGWYSSMMNAGLEEMLSARGIEWLNVFAVDNVLQRIADPVFIGATLQSGKNCGAKVVEKAYPEEGVGVLCLEDGVPNVIEYYELPQEIARQKDNNGKLKFRNGVILNYLFRVARLREVGCSQFPVHVVKKKIPYLDEEGARVSPTEANGFKFETLIIDMVKMMGDCLSFEVAREKEFAPIKNKTGKDSVESARVLLNKNGVKL